jgi:hypothetical protein
MPIILKWGPVVINIVKSGKYEEALRAIIRNLSSSHPDKRLQGKLDMTVVVVQELIDEAEDFEEKERAAGWLKRLRNLSHQLHLPTTSRKAAKERRREVTRHLSDLGEEMAGVLGGNNTAHV